MGKRNCILWTINTNLYQSFGTQILSKSNTYQMFCRLFLKQNFHIYCFSPTEEAKAMFWHCNHQDLISVVHWALNCPFQLRELQNVLLFTEKKVAYRRKSNSVSDIPKNSYFSIWIEDEHFVKNIDILWFCEGNPSCQRWWIFEWKAQYKGCVIDTCSDYNYTIVTITIIFV